MLTGAVLIALSTTAAQGQTFTLDTNYANAMRAIGSDMLIDAPIGEPVYISSFSLCHIDNQLHAVGLMTLEPDDFLTGLLRVVRQADGSVALTIPSAADLFEQDFGDIDDDALDFLDDSYDVDALHAEERLLALQALIQAIPCSDWGDLAEPASTLLPVASVDGHTSLSDLLSASETAD